MFKRIFLFLATNILIMMTLSVIMSALGLNHYITQYGLDYVSLAVFCLVWGMGGAFISLALSKTMAKWMMKVKIINPDTTNPNQRALLQTVHQLSRSAGLSKMPEVGIYQSGEVNAFATGATKNSSLVAVSTGLLQSMDKNSVEGVLGHEVAHIANGDMVTMTLIQGIINAFVLFLSRIIAFAIVQALRGRDDTRGMSYGIYYLVTFILDFTLMILGSMVVAWFSRYREFRADAGGAKLAGRDKMIGALESLQNQMGRIDPSTNKPEFASLKISNHKKKTSLAKLFSTHPPLQDRINRLQKMI
jgi:heat shock protein HtpX